jgi:hypothetical protein
MNEKILIYIVAAIGYYLYTRYQKLQQEATERKRTIESKQVPQTNYAKPVEKQKIAKPILIKTEVNRPRITDHLKENKIKRDLFSERNQKLPVEAPAKKMQLPEVNIVPKKIIEKAEETKSGFEMDLEKMVIYTTIFQQPAYLKY